MGDAVALQGRFNDEPNRAYCYEGLPLLWGTHIGFAFGLLLDAAANLIK